MIPQQQIQTPAWRQGVQPLSNPELGNVGPFYAMTVGPPCGFSHSDWVRAFYDKGEVNPDGSPKLHLADRLEPGILYCIKKDEILMDVDVANGAGEGVYRRDVLGTEERVTPVATTPSDNRRYLLQTHGSGEQDAGLIFFDAFDGIDSRIVNIGLFSKIIRPVTFTPEYQEEHPQVAERIKKGGALALYKEATERGFALIASDQFAAEYGRDLQSLYLRAKPAVLNMYRKAEAWGRRTVAESNARIRTYGSKGAHHSADADYAFYLTGLQPEDMALSRALGQQGLDAGQLENILDRVVPKAGAEPLERPQIWCESCGTYANLSPEGRAPKNCPGCQTPFIAEQAAAATPDFTPDDPMGEETPLQRKQREAKERNKVK
jgi:hypothetical protein